MKQLYLKNVVTLTFDPQKCVGCSQCALVCPHGVFVMQGKKAQVTELDRCMECGACKRNCAYGAIDVKQGVGCAAAVIYGKLNGTEPVCNCGGADEEPGCC